MGKSSKPTIGYRHYMTLYMGHSHSNDHLSRIEIGGELAWEGKFEGSGTIEIDKPELFGGDKREGGVVGSLTIRQGDADQLPHPLLQSLVDGPWPAARGLCTSVFDGQVGAMNPYLKLWKQRWGAFTAGWSTPVWQPDLVKVGDCGKNPMHILYQAFTDTNWGMGWSTEVIDEASWLAAAQTLYDEGFGLCLPYRLSTPIGEYISIINSHIAGEWAPDPFTGKVTYRLIRADYDVDSLPVLDGSNIISVDAWDQALLDGSTNEVTVVGHDAETNKDISITDQNGANIQAQKRVIAVKRQFPGLWNADLVSRVAARECAAASALQQRMRLTVKRNLWGIKRGDVYALSNARRGVVRMPVRILEVDYGTRTDTRIGLVVAQDIPGMAQTTYVTPSSSVWAAPDAAPKPLPEQKVYEASYRDLAGSLSAAELATVEADAGFVVALGSRPAGVNYNYMIATRIGSAEFAITGEGDFTPNGVLVAAIGKTDTSIVVQAGRGLDLVTLGSQVLIGDECCRLDAFNPTTGAATIARACVDSVRATHAAGTRVWFSDIYNGRVNTEFTEGESIDVKLLCRTRLGTLNAALATASTVTMARRQSRPYPPGRVRIAGSAAPASVTGEFTVTWTHRNHIVQADQLVEGDAGSITPPPDQRYGLRVLGAGGAVLVERDDIAGDTATVDLAASGTVTVVLYSINDSDESLQRHEITFAYTAGSATAHSISAPAWTPVQIVIDGGSIM